MPLSARSGEADSSDGRRGGRAAVEVGGDRRGGRRNAEAPVERRVGQVGRRWCGSRKMQAGLRW